MDVPCPGSVSSSPRTRCRRTCTSAWNPSSNSPVPDLELIAVDDCSPDACGAIIDEFAARDARVRAVHLPENVGLGRARNAGLGTRHRRLPDLPGRRRHPHPGRAARHRRPAQGDRRPGRPGLRLRAHVLVGRGRPQPVGAASSPRRARRPSGWTTGRGCSRSCMVVWNKAYRREFVERAGLHLPARLLRGHPLDLSGADVRGDDRHPRPGLRPLPPAPPGQHPRHHASAQALRHLRPVRPGLRVSRRAPRTGRAGARSCSAGWSTTSRTVFIERGPAAARHPRRVPAQGPCPLPPLPHPGRRRPPSATRLRHALVRLGTHRTLPRRCPGGERSAARVRCAHGRSCSGPARGGRPPAPLPRPAAASRCAPTAPCSPAYWGRGHGCNPGGAGVRVPRRTRRTSAPRGSRAPSTTTRSRPATRRLRPGTAAYWTALARSKYLVNNVNFDRRLVKRPGQIMIQTQHGTPLKHMGLDLQDRPAAARDTDFAALLRGADKWDYCLSANRHSTLVWERVFPAALHDAGVRLSAQRRVPAGDFGGRGPAARDASASPRARSPILYAPDAPRLPPHPAPRPRPGARAAPTRPALRRADPRPPLVRRPARAHGSGAGSSTSPTTRASSPCASPRTRWSPTTRP